MLHHFYSDSFLRVQTFDDIKGAVIGSEIFLISDKTEYCLYKMYERFWVDKKLLLFF